MSVGGQKAAKLNFAPEPEGYVPGLGRGATGFTTRSDIGPSFAQIPGRPPPIGQHAQGANSAARKDGRDDDDEQRNEGEFDEFMGNDTGVLAGNRAEYDEDDREADEIWEAIDARMLERRRERREERLKKDLEKYRAENPKITEQFADLKRALGGMSESDWESIPDIGDRSVKNTKRAKSSFVPVPDTLLARAAAEKQAFSTIDAAGGTASGAPNADGTATALTDLTAVGEGRGTVLSLKLDKLGDSVSGQTVVDPKGYLTDLSSLKVNSTADIQDIKKARKLLQSVTQTNPKHAPGWIAAARLESDLGKVSVARSIIAKGCKQCPKSEDIWLHASLLQATSADKKIIIARGISSCPDSVKLYMEAAKLEDEDQAKSRVLRRALERMPNSVRLWRALVDLASEDDARILLSRAVECCPQHVELWLALAKLESYENARKVLNKARQTLPTEAIIWITAAKLEEAHGNDVMVDKIIDRALRSLKTQRIVIDREQWMHYAEDAEKSNPPALRTCSAIIKCTTGEGLEEEDRKTTWIADAEDCAKRGNVETARAIYAHALTVFPSKKGLWRRAAMLEKAHGTLQSLDELLRKAVTYCPQSEMLWLMGAKEKWLAGDVPGARVILQEAFTANPTSEDIMLAAFKLEFENNETERAKLLLQRAREHGGRERVWMKSAMLERELGNYEEERNLLHSGLSKFPNFWKLWLMLAQLEEQCDNISSAKAAYQSALKHCSDVVEIWQQAAALEERLGNVSRARAMLEQGRLKHPKNPDLWLTAVRTERRASNLKACENLMAKALQECPNSGVLWAEVISMASRPQRKSKSVDALKRCDNDPYVVCAVAQLFMNDLKIEKARSWFNRAVTLDPDIGDFWAHYYRFECSYGTEAHQDDILRRCRDADPHHGERWSKISKSLENARKDVDFKLKKTAIDIEKHPLPLA